MSKLICVEGPDGSGKTTQVELIKQHFEDRGISYEFVHFPKYGHNQFSEIISEYLRGDRGSIEEVDPYFVATIYAMDRFSYLPTLKDQLQKNQVVLLDRYVWSNMAFQCARYQQGSPEWKDMMVWIWKFEWEFLKLPVPDLTLYLDYEIDTIKTRLTDRLQNDTREYLNGGVDIHEKDTDLQSRVIQNYRYMSNDAKRLIGDPDWYKWALLVRRVEAEGLEPQPLFESYVHLINKIIK